MKNKKRKKRKKRKKENANKVKMEEYFLNEM